MKEKEIDINAIIDTCFTDSKETYSQSCNEFTSEKKIKKKVTDSKMDHSSESNN